MSFVHASLANGIRPFQCALVLLLLFAVPSGAFACDHKPTAKTNTHNSSKKAKRVLPPTALLLGISPAEATPICTPQGQPCDQFTSCCGRNFCDPQTHLCR